jgi:hypothetical protein
MAAQERTKQAQHKPEPPPPSDDADLLMAFDAPNDPPPPAFDTSLLPPAAAAPAPADIPPPAFDSVHDSATQQMFFPPPPPIDAVAPPPPSMSSAPIFEPSAPSFEDLLDGGHHNHQPNSLETMQAVPPPVAQPDIDEDVLAALDPAEREALLEEQRNIMEQIEKEKANNQASNAAARAMAFDLRSNTAVAQAAGAFERPSSRAAAAAPSSASKKKKSSSSSSSGDPRTVNLGSGEDVPLHDQERTKQAIKDGTAILCQCINCQNWMQVTDNATLMFCPVCQVVSPVERDGSQSVDMEAAAQMTADQKFAEELQQEEYKKAEGGSATARAKTAAPKKKEVVEEGMSWYDWMLGNPKVAPTPERGSSELPSRARPAGLVSAQTGEESGVISYSNSYDEQTRPLAGGGGARMAESKGMFACVTDSISTAAQAAASLNEDPDGNVNGVDSSSLLAMPQVSRQRD